MRVWNVLHAARWKCRTQKITKYSPSGHHRTTCRAISSQLRHISTIRKNLLNSNIFPTCRYNMVNFGLLAAEIVSLVWGTPVNFNGFRDLGALLHGTLVVGISQTLRRWTEGATYIRQGGHHVGPHSGCTFFAKGGDSLLFTAPIPLSAADEFDCHIKFST